MSNNTTKKKRKNDFQEKRKGLNTTETQEITYNPPKILLNKDIITFFRFSANIPLSTASTILKITEAELNTLETVECKITHELLNKMATLYNRPKEMFFLKELKDYMVFGIVIKDARMKANLTLQQLAKQVQISQHALFDIERVVIIPRDNIKHKLCKFFNIDPKKLQPIMLESFIEEVTPEISDS